MEWPTGLSWLLVAQSSPPGTTPPSAAVSDASSVPVIALRRWFGSLTLSSPYALPSRIGLVTFAAGIAGVLLLAMLAQGPRRAIGQFLDLAGLSRGLAGGMARLRASARMVAILLGVTVVSWTAWQTPMYNRIDKKEELALLLKSKTLGDVAIEQAGLAALTPFRDLVGMADTLVLLVGAAAFVFKLSADRWGRFEDRTLSGQSSSGWTTLCWGAAGLYAMYRIASLIIDREGFPPLGGCLFVEVGVVPILMLVSDGLLLSWVLVEMRGRPDRDDEEGFDVAGTVVMVAPAMLACLCAMPSRYLGSAIALAYSYHLPSNLGDTPLVLAFLRGWGLAWVQAGAFLTAGVIGAAAWSHGSVGGTIVLYGRLLREEGGRLAGMLAFAGLLVGGGSALAYYSVLAMPSQPWLLLAADSYAHYVSLPVGLVTMAGLVELASRVASETKPTESPATMELAIGS